MATKSFIKTIGSKGLLADYNTEGKKLQTELTSGTYGIDISGNAATASAAASGSALETAINAKANGDNSVAIFDGYMRRMSEDTGWRRLAYKQFNLTNTNINALFRLYLIGSNNNHIGLGDLTVNVRFDSSGSAPDFKACYLMSKKPLNTSIKLKVVGVAGNAVVEVWFRPPTFSLLMLSCLGNGYDVSANKKDWTFEKYLYATDPEPVEDIANHVYVFSGTVRSVQLNIDSPTNGNLVAMDENGLVKDSGIRITSTDVANWNRKQNILTFDSAPTAGSNNPVTSDGIRTMQPLSHRFDNETSSRLIVWGKANSKGYINDMVRKFGLKYGSITDLLFDNSVHKDNTTSVIINILNNSGKPPTSTKRLRASIFKDSSENSYFALWLDGRISQPGWAYYIDYYPDVAEQDNTVSHFTVFNPSEYTHVRDLTINYRPLALPTQSAGVLTSDGSSNSWLTPPASGNAVLKSVNGVIQWVTE